MPYDLHRRLRTLGSRFAQINRERVIYMRGSSGIPVIASPTLETTTTLGNGGALVRVDTIKWGIDRSELVFPDGLDLPLADDRIIRSSGDTWVPSGDPFFTYATADQTRIILTTIHGRRG